MVRPDHVQAECSVEPAKSSAAVQAPSNAASITRSPPAIAECPAECLCRPDSVTRRSATTSPATLCSSVYSEWRDVASPTNSNHWIGQGLRLRNAPPLRFHGVERALYSRVFLQRLAH